METTEKIVESYVRYLKNWFTIPNIKCKEGQKEIDLLAVEFSDSSTTGRYHIETSVSISNSYSKLTTNPFSKDELRVRVKEAGQRRTLGYFIESKFSDSNVLDTLSLYSFTKGNYKKIIVSWGWNDDVPLAAKKAGVELWNFKDMLREIAESTRSNQTYYIDDTMRTLQLLTISLSSK